MCKTRNFFIGRKTTAQSRRRALQTVAAFVLAALLKTSSASAAAEKTRGGEGRAPYYWPSEELETKLGVDATARRPEGYVRVVYFHRTPGCANCQKMATYVFETVREKFRNEVCEKRVELRYVDFEAPKNKRLTTTLKIGAPTLALIVGRDGKDRRAKKATQIWALVGDKERFKRYVETEIRAALREAGYEPQTDAASAEITTVKKEEGGE